MRSLSVAIPESALSDESLKIDKTRKASVLARACAIFGVEAVYVYREGGGGGGKKAKGESRGRRGGGGREGGGAPQDDGRLLVSILRYLETPQFLRRRLFPKMNDLKFAGVLHPLRIPSHTVPADPGEIRAGDTREGMVVSARGRRFVDVGAAGQLVPFTGRAGAGRRVTVRFSEGHPNLAAREVDGRDGIGAYWGYAVRERASLFSLVSEWSAAGGEIIITSRRGRAVTADLMARYARSDRPALVAFGSPERGVHEILAGRTKGLQNARSVNFFPNQATQTVRLEEALLGALTVINAHVQEEGARAGGGGP